MSATFDVTTAIGKVRALIHDMDTDAAHFDDDTLQVYLDLGGGDVLLGSAHALEAWATLLAVGAHDIRLGEYWEDTTGAAIAMRALAGNYRTSAIARPAFAIANVSASAPANLDIWLNAALRGEI